MNILRCESCKIALIEEEAAEHKCREFTDVWATHECEFWIGDGVQYYPLSTTKLQQSKATTTTHFSTPKNDTPEGDGTIQLGIRLSKR